MNLPVRVLLHENGRDKEIRFVNGAETIEYCMWSTSELYYETLTGDMEGDSRLIQGVIGAFAEAYEQPEQFVKTWNDNAHEF